MSDVDNYNGEETPDDETSLEGKGWDILVGGESHAREMGGDDPFDLISEQDDDVDKIMGVSSESISYPPAPVFDESTPEDAYWDRGRGAEFPLPSSMASGESGAEPRDLSPSELGDEGVSTPRVVVPSAGVTAEVVVSESVTVPELPLDELTSPPGDLSALESAATTSASAATTSTSPFASSSGPAPFSGSTTEAEAETETLPFPLPVSDPTVSAAASADATPVLVGGESPIVAQAAISTMAQPHDPFETTPAPASPSGDELAPDPELEAQLITKERIDALWDEIKETYDLVVNDVRGYYRATDSALDDLKKARELLVAGKEHFDNAEELVNRVKARLRLEEKVRQWSRTRGAWLAVYLVIWLLLITGVFLLTNQITAFVDEVVPPWLAAGLMPGLFGCLGGVVGALWVLIKHIARKRDFDPIHTPWYVTNPFMGFALGIVAYLMVSAGSSGLLGTTTIIDETTASPSGLLTMYALCTVVGFNQNVLWALVDRVIKAILPTEEMVPTVEENLSDTE